MTSKGIASLFLLGLLVVSSAVLSFPSSVVAAETRKCISLEDLTDISHGIWTSAQIRDVQLFLWDIGHYGPDIEEGDLTGRIGTKTQEAIRSFQRSEGLDVTGSIRTKTADKIHKISCGKEKAKPVVKDSAPLTASGQKNSAPSVTVPAKKPAAPTAKTKNVPSQTSEAKVAEFPKEPPVAFQSNDTSVVVKVKPKASPSTALGKDPVVVAEDARPLMQVVNTRTGERAVGRAEWWFTGEPASTITAAPGDRLEYTLSVDGLNEATGYGVGSTYAVDKSVSCHGGVIQGSNPHPWYFADRSHYLIPRNGSWRAVTDGVVDPCQQGRSYLISLGAGNNGGTYSFSSIQIDVVEKPNNEQWVNLEVVNETTGARARTADSTEDPVLTMSPGDLISYRYQAGGKHEQLSLSYGPASWEENGCASVEQPVRPQANVSSRDRSEGSGSFRVPDCAKNGDHWYIVLSNVSTNRSWENVRLAFAFVDLRVYLPIYVRLVGNGKMGEEILYVNPGDKITYDLATYGSGDVRDISNVSGSYEVLGGGPHCGGPSRGAWNPPVLGTPRTDVVEDCQKGNTYLLGYSYSTPDGKFGSSLTVKVGPEAAPGRAASSAGDTSIPPTATFTANDSTNITVSPGDTIRYKWSSTGGSRFVSNFSADQASCGAGANGPWYATNNASGERIDTVQDCQAGRLYTITYDVSNSSGQTVRKTVSVRVLSLRESIPTATFTANGSNDITVSVGDSINYTWTSTGGRSYVSNVIADQPSCGGPANTGWYANNTASGQRTDTVGACQAGRTYRISYDVITGVQSAHAEVIVRVRSTSEARPTVSFTANGADDITVNAGDQINYSWSSTGTGLSSVWSSDQASCGAGSGGTWNANTTQGSRTDTVGECQAGRTFTITANTSNGSQTSAKSVTVRVRPVVKFTANGSGAASVAPTGSVTYALELIPADAGGRITNAYATYTRVQGSGCGPNGETGPWTPPSLNGSRTDAVSSCQAGEGYRITYHYIVDGRTEEKSVLVSIRTTTSFLDFSTRSLGSVFQGIADLLGLRK